MRLIAQIVSYMSLAAVLLPAFLYFFDAMSLERVKLAMLIATIVWFIATPLWMGRAKPAAAS
jgi:hypothetical protein